MLNVTGIQDTRQVANIGCVTYDEWWINRGRKNNRVFNKLCDIEARAIVFADKHLHRGMRKGAVEDAFDKHWKDISVLTEEDQAKLDLELTAHEEFCKRFNSPSCALDVDKDK